MSRRWVLAMSLVVVAGVVAVGLWQWRSVAAFHEHRDEVGMYNQVGTTALVGIARPREGIDPSVLTVRSVEPTLVRGDATADVVVCHTLPEVPGLGTARGRLDPYCESTEAPDGARLGRDDDLVLRISSDEPGIVVVKGVEVAYSHGWRRGSQVIGPKVRVEFGPETVQEHLEQG